MHWQASRDWLHAWPGMFPDEGLDKFESKATDHSMLSVLRRREERDLGPEVGVRLAMMAGAARRDVCVGDGDT